MEQFKILLKPLAVTLIVFAGFMLTCGLLAVYLKEEDAARGFFQTILIILSAAAIMIIVSRKNRRGSQISMRAAFMLVSLIWVMAGFVGALPYYLSQSIPLMADCVFETVSGFTTTGASVLSDVESLPKSILFWRALTHWLGGGGIVVLSVAILPLLGIGGQQMMKAEAPGPKLDKLTPRIGQTAKYLWILFTSMTVIGMLLLMIGGMNLLDAFAHSSSALATGGLSTKNLSVGHFKSAYIEWVIICIMVVGGINFILILRAVTGKLKYLRDDTELKAYLLILLGASAIASTSNYISEAYDLPLIDTIRHSTFQVVTIMTTTGFSSDDYELWPALSQVVIFMLFFVGASSGSTAGGIKVVRHVVLFKQALREIKYMLHPSGVFPIILNKHPIKNDIIHAVTGLFVLYILTILASTLVVSSSGADIITSLSSSLATLGTVGPGFGGVGPTKNYGFFPEYVKYFLSFIMILGRLELYTFLVIFTPWFWKK